MKKTIKEIYEIIKEKRANAISSLNSFLPYTEKWNEIRGEIDAYYDVLVLIENSEVLDNGANNEN